MTGSSYPMCNLKKQSSHEHNECHAAIVLSESGPVNERGESVHFRQGDLDGACGPYSLLMALVTNGIIRREEASYMGLRDGRTRLGKFHNRLTEFGGLISNGTDEFDLDWLGECFSRQIEIEVMEGNTRAMVEQLEDAIRQDTRASSGSTGLAVKDIGC